MDVNKIKIKLPVTSQEIVVPLDMQWDLANREDSIVSEENNIIKQVIGKPTNYELVRFSRRPRDLSLISPTYGGLTEVVHKFYFFSGASNSWENTYLTRFNENEVKFFSKSFSNSFFKFDLYDTTIPQTQKIFLSLILETSQSATETGLSPNGCGVYRFFSTLSFPPNNYTTKLTYIDCCGVEQIFIIPDGTPFGSPLATLDFCGLIDSEATVVASKPGVEDIVFNYTLVADLPTIFDLSLTTQVFRVSESNGEFISCSCLDLNIAAFSKPEFTLDHYGDSKGYYIHWYEDESLLNISELYMRVKFFDGNTGTYTTFTVNPQSNYTKPYSVPNDDFYVRVPFFYYEKWYDLIDIVTNSILPICNWYEYTNPPIT